MVMTQFIWISCLFSLFLLSSQQKSAIATSSLPSLPSTSIPQIRSDDLLDRRLIAEETESQLSDIFDLINQMDDTPQKVNLLTDLTKNVIKQGELDQAKDLLDQAVLITKGFDNKSVQVDLLTNIAPYYVQINQTEEAKNLLTLAVEITNSIEDPKKQSELLLEIAFAYQTIGLEDDSKQLISRSQDLITKASLPVASFPFKETPRELRFGLTGSVNSFRDTTAFLGIDTNYYKQWPKNDIYFNGMAAVSFDSSRRVNNYRPSGISKGINRSS
jgi:tetratricopeptide (TPR) repeat protein